MNKIESEIAGKMSFDIIRYSQVWEDYQLLESGLKIREDDNIFSVCSAGCNVLAMLLHKPKSIVAIDLSPAQNALLELKIAGIKTLEFAEFRQLVGVDKSNKTNAIFDKVKGHLSPSTRDYWAANGDVLAQGVLHTGKLEKFFHTYQKEHLAKFWKNDQIRNLINSPDLATQTKLFESMVSSEFKKDFCLYFAQSSIEQSGRDAAQFAHVEEADTGAYLWDRFQYAMTHLLLRNNQYMQYFLTSEYVTEGGQPPYLREANFHALRNLVDRIKVVQGDIEGYLQSVPDNGFSKSNLSDIFEYMNDELSQKMFGLLAQKTRPQGRIAFWNLFVPRQVKGNPMLAYDPNSPTLWKSDRSWFYRDFLVYEVKKK
ncbi:MAG: DUF3419 family protein [Oligoflexales bacterium]